MYLAEYLLVVLTLVLLAAFSFWTFGELYGKSNDSRAAYQSDAMKFPVNQMSFKFYNALTKTNNNNNSIENKVCNAGKQINRLTNGRTRQIARQINGHIYNCICLYGMAANGVNGVSSWRGGRVQAVFRRSAGGAQFVGQTRRKPKRILFCYTLRIIIFA